MSEEVDRNACVETVVGYCQAINEWERVRYILARIENDQFTSESDRKFVAGRTLDSHSQSHRAIFDRYIVARERNYGSNPGAPNSWSKDGSFYDVDADKIRSVEFPVKGQAAIVTDWGYQFPGGATMFILRWMNDKWLIDNLKVAVNDGWEVVHI